MDNRTRKNQLKIYLTDEEKEIFEKKMRLANCKTMSHFLRKCVLEKEIYIVDLEPFRDLQWLLSNATNNINQIAKATNTTGVIYKNDIQAIRQDVDKLSKEIWDIHSLLLKRIQKIQEYQE
ncbi:TPA: plasmid mobilization relaxosome protein MobC [Streptococcus pyogenes]|nr:plasmid mobilization relaxosome protein MobC [Streptococcus pyogenes]